MSREVDKYTFITGK